MVYQVHTICTSFYLNSSKLRWNTYAYFGQNKTPFCNFKSLVCCSNFFHEYVKEMTTLLFFRSRCRLSATGDSPLSDVSCSSASDPQNSQPTVPTQQSNMDWLTPSKCLNSNPKWVELPQLSISSMSTQQSNLI